jgi:hypothetical protein
MRGRLVRPRRAVLELMGIAGYGMLMPVRP